MSEFVELERRYTAAPERLFAAWTNVDTLRRWFGCGTDMLWDVHAWDVRPGGRIHVSLDFPDGAYVVTGEFLEVDPPRRLAYRWSGDQSVEVTIEPDGTGSFLRLKHSYPKGAGLGDILTGGWSASLQQLAAT